MRKRSKKQRVITAIIVIILLIAMVLTCIIAVVPASAKDKKSAAKIQAGITIGGVDVSGMTKKEADNALSSFADSFKDTVFTIASSEGKSITATGDDLGITVNSEDAVEKALKYGATGNPIARFLDSKALKSGKTKDFPITYKTTYSKASDFLKANEASIVTEPVNNGLTLTNGTFTIVPGKKGVRLVVDDTIKKIDEALAEDQDGSDITIEAQTEEEEPEGSEEALSQVKDKLGSFTTDYSTSSSARKTNVANGASKINGSVIYPGETFSVAATLNPMTAENGYEPAPSYENGTTVETYGGGICQVSTTLYNAVIRAELEVVERSAHSMVVHYVQPSMDAAIAGSVKDFKFKNNQDYPVYIEGITNGSTITFNVYGKETRPANRTVSFESEVLSQTDPVSIYSVNGSLPAGTIVRTSGAAHTGYTARLWKTVTVDGVEQSREVFNSSKYRATNNTYEVGTASSDPNAAGAISAAVATQDKATIEAAAGAYAGTAVDPNAAAAADPNAAVSTDPNAAATTDSNAAATDPNAAATTDPNAATTDTAAAAQ